MSRAAKPTGRRAVLVRLAFALLVLACLVAGIAGGLVRAGVALRVSPGAWLTPAVVGHAFLMICAFFGTVIAIERAVAVRHPLAFVGPAASGLAGIVLLAGQPRLAAWLVAGASLAFIAVNVVVVARQRAAHTALLLVAAFAWAIGSMLHAASEQTGAAIPWWFAFLVLTIAAERLEMTRLMKRRPGASHLLHALCGGLLLGAALSSARGPWGGVLYGASLAGLAVWLMTFDVARRTVRAQGLSRYMAVCLLLGYFWLGMAGAAWAATVLGLPWRDAALHGLGLGFVFSMMLGHAPVILPAVTRVKVAFGWYYYVPLALLHGSLVVRLLPGRVSPQALPIGAAWNALAIAAFLATVAGSAMAWRNRHPSPHLKSPHGVTAEHR